MNIVLEMNALHRKYYFSSHSDTEDVFRIVKGFLKKYGGFVHASASRRPKKKGSYLESHILIEYVYRHNADGISQVWHIPLTLRRKFRNEAQIKMIVDQISSFTGGFI